VPSTGSAAGSFITFLVAARMDPAKDTTLLLDPGFPVHKQQLRVLGLGYDSLDVYEHRGDRLRAKLEEIMSAGKISTVLYSNPNNPTWICFTEQELRIIGELATKYHAVVIEDLAYLTMDFRHDYSRPGEPPFQPTVARYTDRYVLLISSSKVFSYAGQRVAMIAVSNALFREEAPGLQRFYTRSQFGHSLTYGAAYAVSAGVTHSCQHGLAAMLRAASDGTYRFNDEVKAYGRRAREMKRIFTAAGFRIVYDTDVDQPIADGFYFTVAYGTLDGEELLHELLHYGVSAIALSTTGSLRREGIRACVSLVADADLPALAARLARFHADHEGARRGLPA
jgi:aspartate/methionine/tyrosine aminotransferase